MKSVRALLAAILAASAISATGVTAFAAATTITAPSTPTQSDVSSDTTVVATGTTQAPVISVNVPTSMNYILNPYQITGKQQILAPNFTIENKSDVPLKVMVSNCKTSTEPTDVKLITKEPTATSKEKEAYIYLRATVGDAVGTEKFTAASATKAGDIVVATGDMKAPVLLAALTAGDGAASKDGGKATATFQGKLSAPEDKLWAASDKFDITVTYKFIPQMNTVTP